MTSFRIATYNIHKCRGLDRRVRPERIAEVLAGTNADIIALQEVWSTPDDEAGADDQAGFIARALGMSAYAGINRRLGAGDYGNVILSRLPVTAATNYDLTCERREPRGCLRVDMEMGREDAPPVRLRIFNLHLGTSFFERRHQARRLLDENILGRADASGARLVLGDFNEWTRGLASRLLSMHMRAADPRTHLPRARTYPGVLPVLHLDHIYYDDAQLELTRLELIRTRLALVASDHLPLVADFRIRSTRR